MTSLPTRTVRRLTSWSSHRLSPQQQMLLLAIPVGIVAGMLACLYRFLLEWELEFLHVGLTRGEGVDPELWNRHVAAAVLLPATGGLVIGILLKVIRSPHEGMPDLIRALTTGDYRHVGWRGAAHAALSLITIKSGHSCGAEGPTAEMSAIAGIGVGKAAELRGNEVSTLAACGLAAGIAAIFNAPLGGILFALEVVVANMVLTSAAPIVLAAVAGTVVSHFIFGRESVLSPPAFEATSESHALVYFAFLALGLLCGLSSFGFIRSVGWFQKLWPEGLRRTIWAPAIAGLIVGGVSTQLPQVRGVGYEAIHDVFNGKNGVLLLIAIVIAKIACTSVTLSSRAPGGAFAPSLVLGACMGGIMAAVAPMLPIPGVEAVPPVLFVLAGMAAMMAGVFVAPLAALFMIFEISGGNADVMLPVLAATAPAALLSRKLAKGSLYDQALIARGFHRERYRGLAHFVGRTAGDSLRPITATVRTSADLQQVMDSFCLSEGDVLLVVNGENHAKGLITLEEIRQVLSLAAAPGLLVASDMMRELPPPVDTGQNLLETLHVLDVRDTDHVIVMAPETMAFLRVRTRTVDWHDWPIPAGEVLGTISRKDLRTAPSRVSVE